MILCLERAHGCLGAWDWAPGVPPRGSQGGVPAPNYKVQLGSLPLLDPSNSHQNLCRFGCRFLVDLGSILGPSWGSFSVMLAPFSAQVGPGAVFEPSYLRKSDFSRNITFSNVFLMICHPRWRPKTTQDRPKTGPRSSWIAFFAS